MAKHQFKIGETVYFQPKGQAANELQLAVQWSRCERARPAL
jgi:hypothetical protein